MANQRITLRQLFSYTKLAQPVTHQPRQLSCGVKRSLHFFFCICTVTRAATCWIATAYCTVTRAVRCWTATAQCTVTRAVRCWKSTAQCTVTRAVRCWTATAQCPASNPCSQTLDSNCTVHGNLCCLTGTSCLLLTNDRSGFSVRYLGSSRP